MKTFCKIIEFVSAALAVGIVLVENLYQAGIVPDNLFEISVSVAVIFNVIVKQFDKQQLIIPVPGEEA